MLLYPFILHLNMMQFSDALPAQVVVSGLHIIKFTSSKRTKLIKRHACKRQQNISSMQ